MDEGNSPHGARLRTLLCVEDDPVNLMLIGKLVARRPELRLVSAVNGKRGVEIARASPPDVILMDINLPDISGFKALEILRSDPATARIPVVALSANALPLNVESGLEAGFFRYLTKPLNIEELMSVLDAALAFTESLPITSKSPRLP